MQLPHPIYLAGDACSPTSPGCNPQLAADRDWTATATNPEPLYLNAGCDASLCLATGDGREFGRNLGDDQTERVGHDRPHLGRPDAGGRREDPGHRVRPLADLRPRHARSTPAWATATTRSSSTRACSHRSTISGGDGQRHDPLRRQRRRQPRRRRRQRRDPDRPRRGRPDRRHRRPGPGLHHRHELRPGRQSRRRRRLRHDHRRPRSRRHPQRRRRQRRDRVERAERHDQRRHRQRHDHPRAPPDDLHADDQRRRRRQRRPDRQRQLGRRLRPRAQAGRARTWSSTA